MSNSKKEPLFGKEPLFVSDPVPLLGLFLWALFLLSIASCATGGIVQKIFATGGIVHRFFQTFTN